MFALVTRTQLDVVGHAYILTHGSPAANNLRRSVILAETNPLDGYMMPSADPTVLYRVELAVTWRTSEFAYPRIHQPPNSEMFKMDYHRAKLYLHVLFLLFLAGHLARAEDAGVDIVRDRCTRWHHSCWWNSYLIW